MQEQREPNSQSMHKQAGRYLFGCRRIFCCATAAVISLLRPLEAASFSTSAAHRGQLRSWCWHGVTTCRRKRLLLPRLTERNAIRAASRRCTDHGIEDTAFYVHIPYCRRRCRYCDFNIVPIGPVDTSSEDRIGSPTKRQADGFQRMDESYRDAVLTEIELIRRTTENERTLRSIYFGGGTPSLAPAATIESILDAVLSSDGPFRLADDAEITIEMDPGTFDESKLRRLQETGFNRISLGVQSFDDVILEAIGRVHRSADVVKSVAMIRDVYGDEANYSIDLISGLPGLSLAKWVETLQEAVALRPPPAHLSLYDLQVEQGTVFGRWYGDVVENNSRIVFSSEALPASAEALPLPTADDCAFMYKYASGYLRSKGYEHYEISSYASVDPRTGTSGMSCSNRSRHNQIYWDTGSEWYAVGLGATSFVGGERFPRPKQMVDYLSWVQEQQLLVAEQTPSWLPDKTATSRDELDALSDTIMTRLRTAEGLNLDWIRESFPEGDTKVSAVLRGADLALSLGLAQMKEEGGKSYIRLTDPDGFLFSNSIISSIFLELDDIAL